jgi:hypothetical protein
MALARCEHCGRPQGLKQDYNYFHELAYSANSRVLCGSTGCARPSCLWLTDEEERQYLSGHRNFRISNRSLAVQVE